jgi:hypothetical protein
MSHGPVLRSAPQAVHEINIAMAPAHPGLLVDIAVALGLLEACRLRL